MALYNLFISHSWAYGDAYERVCGLLDSQVGRNGFYYRNYSVPKNDPIHNASNTAQLKEAIRAQIRPASVVLILAGVYATYSKWINIEIELAQEMGKKILAIQPFGAEKTSKVVNDAAHQIVAWNSKSIVSGIENLCGVK